MRVKTKRNLADALKSASKCKDMYRFVLHEHYATHHHFDFRLEKFGTLKSWALPKGMPLFIGDKKLAVQTPNHPLSYIDFKGIIPEGEYGAGTVSIADYGCYNPIIWNKNKIEFLLYGKKFKGKYVIIPFYNNFLIIKGGDSNSKNTH